MIRLTQEQFESNKALYSRITPIRKGWYEVVCTCGKCGGHGYLNWTSVDSAKCWDCNTTGKVKEKVQIVKKNPILTPEEVEARIKERREKNRKYWLDKGFKKVDFELEDWCIKLCEVWFNFDDYYRIAKETDKAYLLERVCDIEDSSCYSSYWVPKKGIRFKKEV